MEILFKFQVNRMKIEDFRNLAYVDLLVDVDLLAHDDILAYGDLNTRKYKEI